MNNIETYFKKAFKQFSGKSNIFEEKLTPVTFTKLCTQLIWFMFVYIIFKREDPTKVNKVNLKSIHESAIYLILEGDDIAEKMKIFDLDLKNKSPREIDSLLYHTKVSFNQVLS